ncbi:hypothetical protein [Sphingosinithalassobacter portus]|uniref:hypothetical protein n=1 Tax=Stakelama portus TaxID=2676234 RepID=UPI000D6E16FB|nr:hypothetical protein [Sphingosinithalassobacter portus]
MKLDQQQIDTIKDKTGLTPIPETAAADSGLQGHFGENTFYLDAQGVYVFEELETREDGAQAVVAPGEGNGDSVTAIQIAAVERGEGDDAAVTVRSIQPQATTLTVELAA